MASPSELPKTESAVWRIVHDYIERGTFENQELDNVCHNTPQVNCTKSIDTTAAIEKTIARNVQEGSAIPSTESQVWKCVYDYVQTIEH